MIGKQEDKIKRIRKRTDDNKNRINKKKKKTNKEQDENKNENEIYTDKKRGTNNKKKRKNGLKVRQLFVRLKNSGVTLAPFASFFKKCQTAWE